MTETPWCDCKVAFDFNDIDVWERNHCGDRMNLPEGWSVCEWDGSGARFVIVFRVEGRLRMRDGERVRRLLVNMMKGRML